MILNKSIKRPIVRYHGGKFAIAEWLVSHFPAHRCYGEPYGGGASVLLRKSPAWAEFYNELDGEVVNVFRVMRDPEKKDRLKELLRYTPFSRMEFNGAYTRSEDEVEQARRTIIKSFMGYSSDAIVREYRTGFRSTNLNHNTWRHAAKEWPNYVKHLDSFCERLRGVVIESMEALDFIAKYDSADMLFYVDPPYVKKMRWNKEETIAYRHEMSDQNHVELAAALHGAKGMVILSGYCCELYESLYGNWKRVEHRAVVQSNNGGKFQTESLWISPRAEAAREFLPLFAMAER